jgi:hypothetical protein
MLRQYNKFNLPHNTGASSPGTYIGMFYWLHPQNKCCTRKITNASSANFVFGVAAAAPLITCAEEK